LANGGSGVEVAVTVLRFEATSAARLSGCSRQRAVARVIEVQIRHPGAAIPPNSARRRLRSNGRGTPPSAHDGPPTHPYRMTWWLDLLSCAEGAPGWDLPGYGKSASWGHALGIPSLAWVLLEILDALALERVVLVVDASRVRLDQTWSRSPTAPERKIRATSRTTSAPYGGPAGSNYVLWSAGSADPDWPCSQLASCRRERTPTFE